MGRPPESSQSSRRELPLPEGMELLPREMLWLYPIVPLAAAPLLLGDLFSRPLGQVLVPIAGLYVPFLTLSFTFHALYVWVMPKVVPRLRSPFARGALHVAVTTAVPVLLAPFLLAFKARIAPGEHEPREFALECVIISWIYLFPALIVQRLRNKARTIERMAQLEREAALEAQLKALQGRTNPHFFFNSINTVAALIPENPALAERTLERMADLFRYALDSSKTRLVTLRREVETVRDYLEIQSARYGSRLHTHVELDERAADTLVPPLLLQPLVENAILHGMAHRRSGRVLVHVRHEGDHVAVEVLDDGPGPSASEHRGSQTSVEDLRARLRLLYGERGAISLESAPGGGCLARVAIPVSDAAA
ncbi:histidine kinase [Polyangium sp. 6x1]|uniref:sensor histidine kinase n=1 Tax=Polyangium sp. 6x1 TaxID=3042689 RepID=UPI002482BD99|nr:histidine kinase [Polyangium sp. 6x1]MDI1447436.1 histidine kinase [Polyangium sp. 6x1]